MINMEEKVVYTFIKTTFKDGRIHTEISHPPDQEPESVVTLSHILTTTISMLIKSCKTYDIGIKDYDLIDTVIKYLTADFMDSNTYSDLNIKKNRINNN